MALPQQLPLEFGATPAPTIGNFVATGNEEAVLRLSGLVAELAVGRAADRLVYLWGESGSGRSHLLHAVCAQAEAAGFQARYLEAKAPLEAFEYDPAITIWAIDDAERLDEWAQVAAFNLVNEVRADPHAALITAGPPRRCRCRCVKTCAPGWGGAWSTGCARCPTPTRSKRYSRPPANAACSCRPTYRNGL